MWRGCLVRYGKYNENVFSVIGWLGDLKNLRRLYFGKYSSLTHRGRVTHISVRKLTINGLDDGLWPGRRQSIIWTNAGTLSIRSIWTNFSEILREIDTSLFKKMHLNISSAKWRQFCLGLNMLIIYKSYHAYANVCLSVIGFLPIAALTHSMITSCIYTTNSN